VKRARILNGGRGKWIAEGRSLVKDVPAYARTLFRATGPDFTIRAFRDQVRERIGTTETALVDVRSPQEYSGELIAMPAYPQEGAQRGGHIPTAQSIPWGQNVREDGTFKAHEDLVKLYEARGVTPDKDVIAYCRIGERSSLTWFTLTYLLGYPRVQNYDGSWTEWGSLVGVPIEKSV
jgi:thiosulfate/3-mercaptopyruvate sulfurtransferase